MHIHYIEHNIHLNTQTVINQSRKRQRHFIAKRNTMNGRVNDLMMAQKQKLVKAYNYFIMKLDTLIKLRSTACTNCHIRSEWRVMKPVENLSWFSGFYLFFRLFFNSSISVVGVVSVFRFRHIPFPFHAPTTPYWRETIGLDLMRSLSIAYFLKWRWVSFFTPCYLHSSWFH